MCEDPLADAISFGSNGPRRTTRARPAFDVIAVAASLGGLSALSAVLGGLPANFPASIVVVQHVSARFPSHLPELLSRRCALAVTWAQHGMRLRAGTVYIAPPDHHLQIGVARMTRLSQHPPVQFVRPSADVLFQSIAATYGERAIGVVLTGKRQDGTRGATAIKQAGGRILAQDEETAESFEMPHSAICAGCVDYVLPLTTIAPALVALTMVPGAADLLLRASRARLAS